MIKCTYIFHNFPSLLLSPIILIVIPTMCSTLSCTFDMFLFVNEIFFVIIEFYCVSNKVLIQILHTGSLQLT